VWENMACRLNTRIKATYIRHKLVRTFSGPYASGSYVHRATLFMLNTRIKAITRFISINVNHILRTHLSLCNLLTK
jgi:hypothetical protein